jgi:hypothetical protein
MMIKRFGSMQFDKETLFLKKTCFPRRDYVIFTLNITHMKKFLGTLFLSVFFFSVFSQRLGRIAIDGSGITQSLSVLLDESVIINIATDGKIINYGVEYFSEKITNYSRVENYNGRIEMYAATDDKAFAGKLKYIGRTSISYYASYEDENLQGKIKTIGTLPFTYYMSYDNDAEKGKIKSIGGTTLTYFSSFENVEVKGKLRSVGSTNLSYYSSFDDKAFKGKIKSIGQVSFTYYPSFDRQFAGAMKTGNQTQIVGGITYIIR